MGILHCSTSSIWCTNDNATSWCHYGQFSASCCAGCSSPSVPPTSTVFLIIRVILTKDGLDSGIHITKHLLLGLQCNDMATKCMPKVFLHDSLFSEGYIHISPHCCWHYFIHLGITNDIPSSGAATMNTHSYFFLSKLLATQLHHPYHMKLALQHVQAINLPSFSSVHFQGSHYKTQGLLHKNDSAAFFWNFWTESPQH